MSTQTTELPVTISELAAGGDKKVAVLTLNKPKALNALDLTMAELMLDALTGYAERDDIACVLIQGEGEKAFCAGGDVVSMHQAMASSHGEIPAFLETFFTVEYTLDHTISTFPKPVVVFGSGIVMGGGMGLMTGASHRVVTETSRLAMPEITIGLYPDVGGSYFLPRLPGQSGKFLGLTGASINATDARYLGLADHTTDAANKQTLLAALRDHQWQSEDLHAQVTTILNNLPREATPPEGQVEALQPAIDEACNKADLTDIVAAIQAMPSEDNKWLQRAQKTLAAGSPVTAHLVHQQCQRGAELSLADCYRMELIMSCRCGELGEFQEGVRALLIDKDNNPAWQFTSVSDVPDDFIAKFFTSPWDEGAHPLQSLGEQQ